VSRKLLVSDGKRERELVLVERIVVGRDPTCDLSHDDVLLSRRHAEFVATAERVTIRDLGSRNGIFVNGVRAAEYALAPGDVVQIGPLRVRYAQDSTPTSILPEQLMGDATIVIAPAASAGRAASAKTPLAAFRDDADDGDRTRMLSPAEIHAARVPSATPVAVDPALANGPTLYIAPPSSMPSATAAMQAPSLTSPVAAMGARHIDVDMQGFVFTQVAVVAGVVLLASLLPLLMSGTASPTWIAVSLLAAGAVTYMAGTLINRRFIRVLKALKPDVPLGGELLR
jgi:hypothetical protein